MTAMGTTNTWLKNVVVWLALVLVGAGSLWISCAHIGTMEVSVCLSLAGLMAFIVVVFVMEIRAERFSVMMAPVVGVMLLLLLVTLVATDVASRATCPKSVLPYRDGDGPRSLSEP